MRSVRLKYYLDADMPRIRSRLLGRVGFLTLPGCLTASVGCGVKPHGLLLRIPPMLIAGIRFVVIGVISLFLIYFLGIFGGAVLYRFFLQ